MKNPFRIPNKPYALPSKLFPNEDGEYSWEDWEAEAKRDYPIRYFLSETLPFWYRVRIAHPIDDLWYRIRSYVIPSRRYHMLDLRQPHNEKGHDNYRYGWIDSDSQIRFACFNILVRFIEKEHGGPEKYLDYVNFQEENDDPKREGFFDRRELHSIYLWWKFGRKQKLEEYDNAINVWHEIFKKLPTRKERDSSTELKEASELHMKLEKDLKLEETKMLTRLIELREYMWT